MKRDCHACLYDEEATAMQHSCWQAYFFGFFGLLRAAEYILYLLYHVYIEYIF